MTQDALMHRDAEGRIVLAAPKLGAFTASVRKGDAVASGQVIGTLHVLGARIAVVAPPNVSGRVERVEASGARSSVGYGASLLSLSAQATVGADAPAPMDTEIGGEAFDAPMDGQFYRRPTPEDPPFATEGELVQPGQTIGLIEVMKFFYPIVWEGERPRLLLAWVAEDGPVQAGDTLLRWATDDPAAAGEADA